MSRLIASVREAEERLAGLARALQSAWDEEVAEASAARESARRSLVKALAMQEAAVALGRQELAARVEEVVNQLRAAETNASRRMEELVAAERSFQHRLDVFDASPRLPEASVVPDVDEEIEIAPSAVVSETTAPERVVSREREVAFEQVEPEAENEPEVEAQVEEEAEPEAESVVEQEAEVEVEVEVDVQPEVEAAVQVEPAPAPADEVEEPASEEKPAVSAEQPESAEGTPAAVLSRRVAELERVAARLPLPVLEPALEELVALSRLLVRGPGIVQAQQAQKLLERLRKVAASRGKETTFGLSDDEFADWASLAADARNRRQRAYESFKARRAARQ